MYSIFFAFQRTEKRYYTLMFVWSSENFHLIFTLGLDNIQYIEKILHAHGAKSMTNKHKNYKNKFFLQGIGVAMNDIQKHGVNKMLGNLG